MAEKSEPEGGKKDKKDEPPPPPITWPERDRPRTSLPRVVIKWLTTLKLRHKFLHPRHDAASGALIAEIFLKYYPESGAACLLHGCYGHRWDLYERNWIFLRLFFKSAKIDFPKDLIAPLMTRKGNAGYLALCWIWEFFQDKTKLAKIELGVPLVQSSGAGDDEEKAATCVNKDSIKDIDFFHHDKSYQKSLAIYQRETYLSCFRKNVTDNQLRWDDCLQSMGGWSNRLLQEHRADMKELRKTYPVRMGEKRNTFTWKCKRRSFSEVKGRSMTSVSRLISSTNPDNVNSYALRHTASIAKHANVHAGLDQRGAKSAELGI